MKETYSLSVGENDLARMTLLNDIYMSYCIDFLFENGLKQGLSIADVGCGPGNVSLWLAEQVGETGKVVAIDNSDEQLNVLNKRIAEKQFKHISTYQCDIYEIDQLNEKFDIIFCRFLFIHLSQPLIAIKKLYELLKPGGCLILGELDNSTWSSYPVNEALEQDRNLLCTVGLKKGADFCIGPKLYGYLRQANFNIMNVKIAQPVLFGKHRDYIFLKCKAWAQAYFEFGLISSDALEERIKHLYDLAHDDNYLIEAAKMYFLCGRK